MQAGNIQRVGRADRRVKAFPRLRLIGLALLMSSQSLVSCKNIPRGSMDTTAGHYIVWSKCDSSGLECGKLDVPLDYANPDAGTATLSLARYPATNTTARLGTLLTNPGGPGGSGVGFMFDAGKQFSALFDGRYDIVSWDPRGINGTTPVQCFASETDQEIFSVNGPDEVLPSTRNLSNPVDYAVFRSQVRIADSRNQVLGQLCKERTGEALNHVGTTTLVKDMDRLFRTLEGDGEKVNYWGFSYGTIVGSYFVNMYPDRVGKVVIDGVVEPTRWANTHSLGWQKDRLVDSEKTLHNFIQGCADAGPERCPLASYGRSAKDLAVAFDTLLDKLYEKPLPVSSPLRQTVLTEGALRAIVYTFLYRPRDWPKLAGLLATLLAGDTGPLGQGLLSKFELDQQKPPKTTQAFSAVRCSDTPSFDGISPDAAFEEMMDEIVKAQRVSPHFGSTNIDACVHWHAREAERFTGPFNHSLSNTILVIGNTADPATPLANARAVKNSLGHSARLIVQNGSGHCSLAMTSLCTTKAIRAYFLNGELPKDGLECPNDERLFPAASNDAALWVGSSKPRDSEDLALLHKARDLGRVF